MSKIDYLFSRHQQYSLQAFADCIDKCNRLGAGKWGITEGNPHYVKLLFGCLITASIEQGLLWLAMPAKADTFLDDCKFWKWTPIPGWEYKRPPSRSGFYIPWRDFEKTWPEVRKRHFAYLTQCGDVYTKLRKTSRRVHSNDFLIALESAIGRKLPIPKYY